MRSVAWKNLEREVARAFGGCRRVRIDYSERGSDVIHSQYSSDVIHSQYSIECKYGKQIPAKALEGKRCKFLDYAFAQAINYNPTLVPMVCLKTPGQRGFVSVLGYPHAVVTQTHKPCSL